MGFLVVALVLLTLDVANADTCFKTVKRVTDCGFWSWKSCTRYATQSSYCIHGGWSDWTVQSRSSCSASCGGGTLMETKTRTCSNPAPLWGGSPCTGSPTMTSTEPCNTNTCLTTISSSSSKPGKCSCDGFVDDSACTTFPCLIFEDNFDFLNVRVWEHEITAGGGGNWEFQYYTNNRTNSYTRDGVLYIKPTLTTDALGTDNLESGSLDLWGGSPADVCTSNAFWGCKRDGQPGMVINPIQSARLRSSKAFNFRYGKVEVEAKLPVGDWLWPAIWMLPRLNAYGGWPASGEIDIMESRGNVNYTDPQGNSQGVDSYGSTLHFGTNYFTNRWPTAHTEFRMKKGTFADDFHKYGVEWSNISIIFTLDGQEVYKVEPGAGGFWQYGGLDNLTGYNNPWLGGSHMAPFDQEFYIILNLAVGGVGFFKDENVNQPYPKPWSDTSGHAATDFWNARNLWYPTWQADLNNGEAAALKVNYVKVWKTQPDP